MISLWDADPGVEFAGVQPGVVDGRRFELVVVGAGIVGLSAALKATESGLTVCVVEALTVGSGASAHSTGKVTPGHGSVLTDIDQLHGSAAAGAYQQLNDVGYLLLESWISSLPEQVGWSEVPHVVYGRGSAGERVDAAATLAASAGSAVVRALPPAWAGSSATAWSWPRSALVNPVRLLRALARRLSAEGGVVVEHARVVGIDDQRDGCLVRLEGGGSLSAGDVLVSTHSPVHDPDGVTLRMGVFRRPAVAVATDDHVPSTLAPGGFSTRPATLPDGRAGAVVVGPSHRITDMPPRAWDEAAAWAAESLHAGPAEHRWAAQDPRRAGRLPAMGRSGRHPRVVVVTGMNGWGFTNAAGFAAHLPALLDRDERVPWEGRDERTPSAREVGTLVADVWSAGRKVVADTLGALTASGSWPAPGQGVVSGGPVRPVARCQTSDGALHAVSARCPHLGCLVRWSAAEQMWECPCHGSRFAPDGRVIEGPASRDLASVEGG